MNEDRQRQIGAALGHAIAARREKAGLTQEQVSEMLGIGNQAISRIERGAVAPTVFRLYEFAGVFDCRVEDLLRESSDRTADHASHLMQTLEGLTPEDQRALVSAFGLLADQFRKNATTKRASR